MGKLTSSIDSHFKRRRLYLAKDRGEIEQTNMTTLRYASLLTVVLLVTFLVLAFLLIDGWQPSPYHLVFLPVSLIVCILAWRREDEPDFTSTMLLCTAYEIMLYAFVIMIDTLGGPDAPNRFVQLACVAMPSLFVLPSLITYGLLFIAELSSVALILTLKNGIVAQYDIFGLIAGLFFAICVSQLVMESRLKAYEAKMRYEAMSKRDTLSSLYNKRAFFEHAEHYFKDHNPSSFCSLAVIDIDNFKEVNDTYGHSIGDKLLTGMGDSLLELYRPTDLIARFGGDEYLVLADHMIDEGIIRRRFNELQMRVAEKTSDHINEPVTFSMGVTIVTGQNVVFAELFQQADEALYEAKNAGKNTCEVKRYRNKQPE